IDKADQVRPHVRKNAAAFGGETFDAVIALYPTAETTTRLLHEDAERFAAGVQKTGAQLSATEPILALSQRFEAELDLNLAATEAGVTPEEFLRGLARSPRLSRAFGQLRLEGGTVQRQAFAAAFGEVVRTFHAPVTAPPPAAPEGPSAAP